MLDWVIVGGGLQGVLLANALTYQKAGEVWIVDPHPVLCHRWNRVTANTGMRYMRSPQVHHIDVDPYSLQRFAIKFEGEKPNFIPPYYRPSYGLFQAHTQHVIEQGELDRLHRQATALHLKRQRRGRCVETDKGSLRAWWVVLATGRNRYRKYNMCFHWTLTVHTFAQENELLLSTQYQDNRRSRSHAAHYHVSPTCAG